MKKISLYVFSLLVLAGFSACDEDYTDWANPQSNPQEESKSGITAQVAGVTSEVVMDTYAEDSVVIAKLESLSGSDEIVGYKLQLAGNDKTLDIPFAEKDGALKVDAAELELLTMQLYNSRQAVARDIAVKVGVSAMASDNQAVSVDVADINMKVTPVTPPAMEDEYYALGDISSWDLAGALAFTRDADDDAIFTLEFTNEKEDKANFKIFPKSGAAGSIDWNKALGAMKDGDASASGLLDFTDQKGQQAGAIGLELQGKVRITINVKDYTYTIKEVSDLPETMFINGSAYSSDWNWNDACQMIPVTQTPGMFWSMQYYNAGEEIKFSPVAGWTGDFGFSTDIVTPAAIELAGLTDKGGNILIGISGWYIVVVTVDKVGGKKVEFLRPEVYLLGGLVNGSWNCNEETLFTVPADKNGDFVSPAATADGVARICCTVAGTGNWWKSEFTLDMKNDASIVYRENKQVGDNLGELGYECPVNAGQKVYVNFTNGNGTVK